MMPSFQHGQFFKNIYRGRQTGIMNPMNSLSNFSDDRVVNNLILPVSSLSKWFYWVNISIQLKAFCVSLDEGSCHETAYVWDYKAYLLPHTDSCWIKSSYVGDNSLWLLEKNTEENSRTFSQAINYSILYQSTRKQQIPLSWCIKTCIYQTASLRMLRGQFPE